MKAAQACLFLLLLSFFVGCATSEPVRTETVSNDRDFSLADVERFAVNLTRANTRDVRFGPEMQEDARDAIVDSFEKRGYILVDADRADFEVMFATYTEQDAASIDGSARPVAVVTEDPTVVSTDRDFQISDDTQVITTQTADTITMVASSRVFVVDVINPDTNELVWRGYTRRGDTALDDDLIEDEIERIISAFPYRNT